MFCNNCGKELEAGDVFCGYCGARLEPVPEPIVEEPAAENVTPTAEEPVQPTQESPVTSVPPVSGNSTAGEGFSTSMEVTAPTWADNWKHNKGIRNLIAMGIFILWLLGVFSPIANFFDGLSGPSPMMGLSMLLTASIYGGSLFIMVILLCALILSFPFLPLLSPRIFFWVSLIYVLTGIVYAFLFISNIDLYLYILGKSNGTVLLCSPILFGLVVAKIV